MGKFEIKNIANYWNIKGKAVVPLYLKITSKYVSDRYNKKSEKNTFTFLYTFCRRKGILISQVLFTVFMAPFKFCMQI